MNGPLSERFARFRLSDLTGSSQVSGGATRDHGGVPRSVPRVPSLWVVLLPALALVALGARAVVAESRAEEGRVRERTRAAAARVARSLATVVGEYERSLDGPRTFPTPAALREEYRHFFPLTVLDVWGREIPPDGAALPSPEAADAYVADAIEAAARLGDDAAGDDAAAAFLRAAAGAAPAAAAGTLELLAAVREPGRHAEALALFERTLANPGGLGLAAWDAAMEDAERRLGTAVPEEWRARRFEARDLAGYAASLASEESVEPFVVTVRPGAEAPRVAYAFPRRLGADGAAVPVAVAGEIPATALRERVGGEARALVDAGGVLSAGVVAPDGSRSLGAGSAPTGSGALVESVALEAPFGGWRVEAVSPAPTGVPGSAVALAAAVVVAAGALVAGLLALRRAAREQARLADERQAFLDHVAHEVRTPAAALLALSEELDAGRVPADRARTYHGHLATESRRLARLVDDTLDLSRLDAGRLVFETAPADLREIAREGAAAAGGGDRVVVRVPEAPVTVRGDGAALRRVVRNLVDNALRHGGADRPVEVEVGSGDALASLAVRDHGRGIAPEHAARLFERFFRVPSATHETKGVGLGLALCREVARAHGGDVDVESEVGRGTTFTLRLPVGTVASSQLARDPLSQVPRS